MKRKMANLFGQAQSRIATPSIEGRHVDPLFLGLTLSVAKLQGSKKSRMLIFVKFNVIECYPLKKGIKISVIELCTVYLLYLSNCYIIYRSKIQIFDGLTIKKCD